MGLDALIQIGKWIGIVLIIIALVLGIAASYMAMRSALSIARDAYMGALAAADDPAKPVTVTTLTTSMWAAPDGHSLSGFTWRSIIAGFVVGVPALFALSLVYHMIKDAFSAGG